MWNLRYALFFVFLNYGLLVAQTQFVKHEQHNHLLTVETTEGTYRFAFYNPQIVETSFIPKNQTFDPISHAVVAELMKTNIPLQETSSALVFGSKALQVVIQKSPFELAFYANEQRIISEKEPFKIISKENEKALHTLSFQIDRDEYLMGGGARVLGMNRRGNRLELYNRAHYGYEKRSELMNYTLPIVLSSKKYLLHFDNSYTGFLDLDSALDDVIRYEAHGGRMTYQLIVGEEWSDVVKNYTTLTGRQPLPARWTLGNFASRFGYRSEQETRNTVDAFAKAQIPLDAVILDLYWFGKEIQGTMGNLEVYRDSFPNFEKMVADFRQKGIRTIPITEPFILTTSKRWEEAVRENVLVKNPLGQPLTYDFYFGNTGIVDVFKPEAQQWFWNIYKDLALKGVGGVWGDLGEPEVFPTEAQTHIGPAPKVHNIYGHQWAKTVYEGYRRDFPKERPFILMRAGAAGSQRYGMIPWSGDVNRTWGGLYGQTEIALQMGLQGLAYMHSDLGGFAGNLVDDELYIRWLQYGVFQPIFRPHAQEDVPSEPVFRSREAEFHAKRAIDLRYRLLLYNYQLAYENHKTGMPLMRPLFFEEPENKPLYTFSKGYLWGNDFLVYPIVEPNQKTQNVYFPKTSDWVDFYTAKKYQGGTFETVEVHLRSIPTFVRSGSIIPLLKVAPTTAAQSLSQMEVHWFMDDSSEEVERSFYWDDGETFGNIERGNYFKLHFEGEKEKRGYEFEIELEGNKSLFQPIDMEIHLRGISSKPRKIRRNGKKIVFTYDFATRTVIIPTRFDGKELEFKIRM